MLARFSIMVALGLVLAVIAFSQENGGVFNNAVTVRAVDGQFDGGRSGRTPLSQSGARGTLMDFLDSTGALYVEQVFLDFDPAETLFVNLFGDTFNLPNLGEYYRIEFTDSVWWEDLCSAWTGTDSFEVLGQALYGGADYPVNDEHYDQQQYLWSTYPGCTGVDSVWLYTTGSENVKVCIVDDGVDQMHEDLYQRIDGGYRGKTRGTNIAHPDASTGHGTHVAGIVGAATNNDGRGVAGINRQSPLLIARSGEDDLFGIPTGAVLHRYDYGARCVRWATLQGADVINMSGDTQQVSGVNWASVCYSKTNWPLLATMPGVGIF